MRNPTRTQGPSTSVIVVGIHWSRVWWASPSNTKQHVAASGTLTAKEEASHLVRTPWHWRQHTLQLGVLIQFIYWVTPKLQVFRGALNKDGSTIGLGCHASCSATWVTGPSRPKGSGTISSVADRDAIWYPWQDPVGESQHKRLRFGSKALPSSVDNDSPFDKLFLAC